MSESVVTGTVSGPASSPVGVGDRGAGAVVVLADDRLLVVGRSVSVPAVSPTVWSPVFSVSSPVEPPSPTSVASPSVVPSIWRLNRPPSVVGLEVLLDLELAGLTGVRDHADDVGAGGDRDGQGAGVVAGRAGDHRAGAVVGLALDRLLVVGQVGVRAGGLADGVVPVFSVSSPVEPPSPTLVASPSVVPSIWRLNRPSSVLGLRSFCTSSLPVSRVFVITQTMSEPVVTLTFSGPALSRSDAGDHGAGAVVGPALDRLLVVVEVGARAGDLTDGVGPGVERLLAGRAAVADVVRVGVRGAVDLQVELAGVGRRAERPS